MNSNNVDSNVYASLAGLAFVDRRASAVTRGFDSGSSQELVEPGSSDQTAEVLEALNSIDRYLAKLQIPNGPRIGDHVTVMAATFVDEIDEQYRAGGELVAIDCYRCRVRFETFDRWFDRGLVIFWTPQLAEQLQHRAERLSALYRRIKHKHGG